MTSQLGSGTPGRSRDGGPPGMLAAGMTTLAASVVAIPLALATSIVIARALGPSSKGVYDLAIASVTLLALVLGFALPSGITYSVAKGSASPRRVALLVPVVAVAQASAAYILIAAIGRVPDIGGALSIDQPEALALPIAAAVGVVAGAASMKAIAMGRQRIVTANWIDALGRVALLLGAVLIALAAGGLHATPFAYLVVMITVTAATAVSFAIVGIAGAPKGGELGLRTGIRIAAPSWVANVLQFLNYRLDLFLVAYFLTTADVGYYALAATLTQLIWLLSNSIGTVVFPRVASGSDPAATATARTSLLSRLSLESATLLGLAVAILAQPVIGILYGREYLPAVPAILCLIPGIVVFAPVNIIASHLAGTGRPELNMVASAGSVVVTVVLDLVLIPSFGIVGAAAATTASYGTAAVIIALMYSRASSVAVGDAFWPRLDDVRYVSALVGSHLRSRRTGHL
jgi:O-antigen/teichoic acid export membrane protein